jgi:hypothetical protein
MSFGAKLPVYGRYGIGVGAVLVVSLAGCPAPWDAPRGSLDAPPGQAMSRMQLPSDTAVDPELLDARAWDMQRVAEEIRAHVGEMRALPPPQLHGRMMEHTARVARLGTVVTRHTTDMYQRFGLDEQAVAAHFGMQADEHRAMMNELRSIREEAGRLQVELQGELQKRMPAHLDRLDAVAARVAQGAERMATSGR